MGRRKRSRAVIRVLGLILVIFCLNLIRSSIYTQERIGNLQAQRLQAYARSQGLGNAIPPGRSLNDLRNRAAQEEERLDRSLRREAEERDLAKERQRQDELEAETRDVEKPEHLSAFERQLERYQDALVDRPIRQFGYEVFSRIQPRIADAPVGKDYLIGPGDDLVVSIWGSIDLDVQNVVDRDGQLRLPQIGPVPLKGLTLKQAEETLTRRFDRFYKNYELQVQVGRLRDISIHVIGRVAQPGRQRVSSDATLLDALIQAGGVNKDGSLRHIVIRRQGEESRRVDLYDYLLDGELESDVVLRANDVDRVFIIRADGSAISEQNFKKSFLWDNSVGRFAQADLQTSKLGPGDTIVMPYDIEPQVSNLGLTTILFQAILATGVVIAAI